MLCSKFVMPNLFEYARKKFNGDLNLMTSYVVEVFDKANLMHHIANSNRLEDIKLSYKEVCTLAEKSNIPLDELLK